MSGLAGSNGANLRLVGAPDPTDPMAPHIVVEVSDDGIDVPEFDDSGNVVRIQGGDGSITVSLDGKPIEAAASTKPVSWFDNLAETIGSDELSRITEDLLQGIADDLDSRKEWIEDRAMGVKLLGLKIEPPNTQGSTDGAPVEGMSKVRHPLLLEAVLRFQANARSELLPTDGPVKIRNDSSAPTLVTDEEANLLERDMNHYLTTTASEYYPDTDRMLLMTGFGGDGFKKVYKCPLRNRAVSESVDADDLIVNQSATDLQNAQRVTHKSMMKPSTVKRMQILGVYRDIELSDAVTPQPDALQEAEKEQQGITVDTMRRPGDRERQIYECCCELDIKGIEHKKDGKITGLAVPYVATIDVSSREMLSLVRNYKQETEDMPVATERFVKYPFVPGMGFYSIGLLHILGNTTNAVTAAWRLMLDNGMFANFPGFLTAKSAGRQNTNVFRVPPGGSAQIDTSGASIRDFAMALPYNTAQMPPLMTLTENMAETGQRIGGTAEVQVGEGRADVPVGTVMAMIDQAIKVMNAVHKRMHAAQAKEFQLLRQLIKEDPESFLRTCNSKTPWDKTKFMNALNNCALVPQADPNTSSSGQRMMKVMGLKQLQTANPTLYDPIKCDTAALNVMGWSNPEEFFVPPAARSAPPPQLLEAQAKMANDKAAADAKTAEASARVTEAKAQDKEADAKIQAGHFNPKPATGVSPAPGPEPESSLDQANAQAKLMDAETRRRQVAVQEHTAAIEDQNRDQDRAAQERDAAIGLAKEVIQDPRDAASAGKRATGIMSTINKFLGKT